MFTIKSTKEDFPKSTGKKYKVLINAGGGLFGYVITNFMSYLNFDLYSKVDCVAGTSIGGILTLAYCCNNDYKWINEIFEIGGPKIFEKVNTLYGIAAPKYNNKNLKNFLEKIYGSNKLSDINRLADKDLHTIIPVMDFTLTQPRIFNNIDLPKDLDIDLVDLGLYTSAAPTYFDAWDYTWKMIDKYSPDQLPINERILLLAAKQQELITKAPNIRKESTLLDGGVLENIPIISTYTTLHNELGVEPKDIDMFVIGTGNFINTHDYTAKDISKWTILDYCLKMIVPYVTSSNEQMSVFWGTQMGFNSFTYFNPIDASGEMDDASILPGIKYQCENHKDEFIEEINNFLKK